MRRAAYCMLVGFEGSGGGSEFRTSLNLTTFSGGKLKQVQWMRNKMIYSDESKMKNQKTHSKRKINSARWFFVKKT